MSFEICIYTCVVVLLIEMMRQQQRELRKTNRELERDRGGLERQERHLVSGGWSLVGSGRKGKRSYM